MLPDAGALADSLALSPPWLVVGLSVGLAASGVAAVLCEHEMPGWSLGRRLPFDTPSVAPPSAAADPVVEAFAELGLEPGADEDAAKRAYRDRAKDVHPDTGGDEDEFKRVQEAYATARTHADA